MPLNTKITHKPRSLELLYGGEDSLRRESEWYFVVTVGNKTQHHSCQIHPKLTQNPKVNYYLLYSLIVWEIHFLA